MRILLITLGFLLLTSLEASAQEISRKLFNNSHWFTDNSEGRFYSADTVLLFRIIEFNSYQDEANSLYIELQYNASKDITQIDFKRFGIAEVSNLFAQSWTRSVYNGQWTWKFKKRKNTLQFFLDHKLSSEFEVISTMNDKMISRWGYDDGQESELKLTILKLKRKK
jgi:hypothetical protein